MITYNPKRKNQFAGITDMRAEVMDLYPCLLLLCMVTVYVTFAQQPSDEDWLELDTPQGPVRGRRDPETELYVFYNIPYATAPVKENKYKVFEKQKLIIFMKCGFTAINSPRYSFESRAKYYINSTKQRFHLVLALVTVILAYLVVSSQ